MRMIGLLWIGCSAGLSGCSGMEKMASLVNENEATVAGSTQNEKQLSNVNSLMDRLAPPGGNWILILAGLVVLALLLGYVLSVVSLLRMRRTLARLEANQRGL
jgi:hypothetical protein